MDVFDSRRHSSLRRQEDPTFSVQHHQYRRHATLESATLELFEQNDDTVDITGSNTNLTLPSTSAPNVNVFETATDTPNITIDSILFDNQSPREITETTTKYHPQSRKVDTIVTSTLIALIILLAINLALLLYKPIEQFLRRRYRNLKWVQQRRKQRRYNTIDEWLVTKTVQPHDWICDFIRNESKLERMRNDGISRKEECGAVGGASTAEVLHDDDDDDDPRVCGPNHNLLENIHWLCQKMELTCQLCPSSEKKEPTKQNLPINDIIGNDEQQHDDDEDDRLANGSDSMEEEEQRSCSICLERFRVGDIVAWSPSIQCGHVYHHACIRDWLLRKIACPYCRVTVLPVDRVMEKGRTSNNTTTTIHNAATALPNTQEADHQPPNTDDEAATVTPNATGTPPQSRKDNCPSSSSSRSSSGVPPKPTRNDLVKERLLRLQTTYFCVDCGLVLLAPS